MNAMNHNKEYQLHQASLLKILSKKNYELKLFDNTLRNFLIDGIALEEQRLEDAWSEEFTNVVRGTNTKKYDNKTILNGVEFVKNKNIF